MPFPMVPAPSTATVLIASIAKVRTSRSREIKESREVIEARDQTHRKIRRIGQNSALFRWSALNDLADNFARQHFLLWRNVHGCFAPVCLDPHRDFIFLESLAQKSGARCIAARPNGASSRAQVGRFQ